MRKLTLVLVLTVTLLLSGCEYLLAPPYYHYGRQTYIVRIESDTEWEGYVGDMRVSGFGNRSYQVQNRVCWDIQKIRIQGLLRVFVTYSEYYAGSDYPIWEDRATTASYGTVRGCM